ncbi:MAG: ABC transporter permease, partial [Lachnospiraceae bacterium]|nr:ABC transporter permease [Lachnospiraceae bacterium]
IIGFVLCAFLLLVAGVLALIRSKLVNGLETQQMAKRWSESGDVTQISCFFSRNADITRDRLIAFEHNLDAALEEASIKTESENPGARLWKDAYSAKGSVNISTDRASLHVKALGVGGDFFDFHPQELLYGNYFSESDINQDYVVIDEEIAWQLFGGIDVSGKNVEISGRPFVIAGVIHRPQEKIYERAGLTESLIYLSYEALLSYGSAEPISHYEIVMPNPIKGFAMNMLKEKLMADEYETSYVENSIRYSYENSLKRLKDLPYRAMNDKAILYPYWENIARAYEDILAILALFVVICIGVPAVITFVWLIYRWKHKKWNFQTVKDKLVSWKDLGIAKLRSSLKKKKQGK